MKENGNHVTNVSVASSVTNDDLFVDDLPPAQNELRSDFIESPAAQKRDIMKVVGKQVPHDSAVGHVTGDALFVDDLPFTKTELVVDFIGSPVAHGEIIDLNSEELAQLTVLREFLHMLIFRVIIFMDRSFRMNVFWRKV